MHGYIEAVVGYWLTVSDYGGCEEPHWSFIIYSCQPVTGYTVTIYSLIHLLRHSWSAWLLKVGLIHHP